MNNVKEQAKIEADYKYGRFKRPLFQGFLICVFLSIFSIGSFIEDNTSLLHGLIILKIFILIVSKWEDSYHQKRRKLYQNYQEIYLSGGSKEIKKREEILLNIYFQEIKTKYYKSLKIYFPICTVVFIFLVSFWTALLLIDVIKLFDFFYISGQNRGLAYAVITLIFAIPTSIHFWRKTRMSCAEDVEKSLQSENYWRDHLTVFDANIAAEARNEPR